MPNLLDAVPSGPFSWSFLLTIWISSYFFHALPHLQSAQSFCLVSIRSFDWQHTLTVLISWALFYCSFRCNLVFSNPSLFLSIRSLCVSETYLLSSCFIMSFHFCHHDSWDQPFFVKIPTHQFKGCALDVELDSHLPFFLPFPPSSIHPHSILLFLFLADFSCSIAIVLRISYTLWLVEIDGARLFVCGLVSIGCLSFWILIRFFFCLNWPIFRIDLIDLICISAANSTKRIASMLFSFVFELFLQKVRNYRKSFFRPSACLFIRFTYLYVLAVYFLFRHGHWKHTDRPFLCKPWNYPSGPNWQTLNQRTH